MSAADVTTILLESMSYITDLGTGPEIYIVMETRGPQNQVYIHMTPVS